MKEGKIRAINCQTAEGDGALAVKTAADWFNGEELPPLCYCPQRLMTIDDMDDFHPPQR